MKQKPSFLFFSIPVDSANMATVERWEYDALEERMDQLEQINSRLIARLAALEARPGLSPIRAGEMGSTISNGTFLHNLFKLSYAVPSSHILWRLVRGVWKHPMRTLSRLVACLPPFVLLFSLLPSPSSIPPCKYPCAKSHVCAAGVHLDSDLQQNIDTYFEERSQDLDVVALNNQPLPERTSRLTDWNMPAAATSSDEGVAHASPEDAISKGVGSVALLTGCACVPFYAAFLPLVDLQTARRKEENFKKNSWPCCLNHLFRGGTGTWPAFGQRTHPFGRQKSRAQDTEAVVLF